MKKRILTLTIIGFMLISGVATYFYFSVHHVEEYKNGVFVDGSKGYGYTTMYYLC